MYENDKPNSKRERDTRWSSHESVVRVIAFDDLVELHQDLTEVTACVYSSYIDTRQKPCIQLNGLQTFDQGLRFDLVYLYEIHSYIFIYGTALPTIDGTQKVTAVSYVMQSPK